MNEELITKLRAGRMTPTQLTDEINRIAHAITKAARPREVARYERRRAIFERERASRPPAADSDVMSPTRMD